MALINKRKVRQMAHKYGKTVSVSFYDMLDYKVRELVKKACKNARQFKRITRSELL